MSNTRFGLFVNDVRAGGLVTIESVTHEDTDAPATNLLNRSRNAPWFTGALAAGAIRPAVVLDLASAFCLKAVAIHGIVVGNETATGNFEIGYSGAAGGPFTPYGGGTVALTSPRVRDTGIAYDLNPATTARYWEIALNVANDLQQGLAIASIALYTAVTDMGSSFTQGVGIDRYKYEIETVGATGDKTVDNIGFEGASLPLLFRTSDATRAGYWRSVLRNVGQLTVIDYQDVWGEYWLRSHKETPRTALRTDLEGTLERLP